MFIHWAVHPFRVLEICVPRTQGEALLRRSRSSSQASGLGGPSRQDIIEAAREGRERPERVVPQAGSGGNGHGHGA